MDERKYSNRDRQKREEINLYFRTFNNILIDRDFQMARWIVEIGEAYYLNFFLAAYYAWYII